MNNVLLQPSPEIVAGAEQRRARWSEWRNLNMLLPALVLIFTGLSQIFTQIRGRDRVLISDGGSLQV